MIMELDQALFLALILKKDTILRTPMFTIQTYQIMEIQTMVIVIFTLKWTGPRLRSVILT